MNHLIMTGTLNSEPERAFDRGEEVVVAWIKFPGLSPSQPEQEMMISARREKAMDQLLARRPGMLLALEGSIRYDRNTEGGNDYQCFDIIRSTPCSLSAEPVASYSPATSPRPPLPSPQKTNPAPSLSGLEDVPF